MSFTSENTAQNFPFSYDEVYDGLVKVLRQQKFKIKNEDRVIGRVTASAGMSLFSWGENLSLSIQRVDEGNTILSIDSSLKFGGNFTGGHRHRANFDKIIMALSKQLQSAPAG